MTQDLRILHEVQQCDLEIAERQKALSALDSGEELNGNIASIEEELAQIRQQREQAEAQNLDYELELKTLQEKRERFQKQLYSGSVSNPRQLSDLQGEVDMLGREIGKIEDEMLELLELLESTGASITQKEAQLAELKEQLAKVRSDSASTEDRLKGEISELETQRRESAAKIDPPLLRRYEQIRVRAGNVGIVNITGSMCPACRIALPSETIKEAKAGRVGLTCDNCGRLLYWEQPEED